MLLFQKKISSGAFVNRKATLKWVSLLRNMRGLNFFRVLFNLSTTLPAKPRESFSNNLLSNSKIRTLNFNSSNLTSRLNLLSSLFLRFEAIYPPFSVNQSRVFSQTYKILPQLFLKRLGALFLATEFMRRTTATFWINVVLLQFFLVIIFLCTLFVYFFALYGVLYWDAVNLNLPFNLQWLEYVPYLRSCFGDLICLLDLNVSISYSWLDSYSNLSSTVALSANPAHLFNFTPAVLFQDFEIMFSYTEIINFFSDTLFQADKRLAAPFFFFTFSLTCIFFFLVMRTSMLRSDAWQLFFNFSYRITRVGRLQSLEVLNQLTRDKIYAISKNKDFFLQNLYFSHGVAKPTISGANCFEYYFSQTVGGVVGFIDLFPHQTTFYNDAVVTKVRIKTFIFFNKIRGILIKKVRALGSYRVATSITSKRLNKFKDSAIKRPTIFTDFLASRLYLEPEFSFFYRNFDWLFNVSKLGDYGVLKLRRYFFKAAVWARDPWDDWDESEGRDNPRVRMSVSPQRINWYGRELSSVSLSKTLFTQLRLKSLFRFRMKRHNNVNDFSFWKTELNYHGLHTYFSSWDSFSAQNDFDISVLADPKFDFLERTSSDEDDEFHPEYVFEDSEVFFEDGLLHKDFELIFFDHEFDDLVVEGQLDEYIDELEESPKLKAVVTNESLIYRAGQEGDYSVKTTADHYSGHYSLEYAGASQFSHQTFDSVYEELSDFMALNSRTILPRILGIPQGRSVFYWGGVYRAYGNFEISERYKRGRFVHLYWRLFSSLLSPNYYAKWLYSLITLALPLFLVAALSLVVLTWAYAKTVLVDFFMFSDLALLLLPPCLGIIILLFTPIFAVKYHSTRLRRHILLAFWTNWRVGCGFVTCLWFLMKRLLTRSAKVILYAIGTAPNEPRILQAAFLRNLGFVFVSSYWNGGELPPALNFFFNSYNLFSEFKVTFGVSDIILLRRITSHTTPSARAFLPLPPRTGLRTVVSFSNQYDVHPSKFTAAHLKIAAGHASWMVTPNLLSNPPVLLYDFQLFGGNGMTFIQRGLNDSNFVFGNFLQDDLRVLRKTVMANQTSKLLTDGFAQLRALSFFKQFSVTPQNSCSTWADLLSDFLFGLSDYYPTGNSLRFKALSGGGSAAADLKILPPNAGGPGGNFLRRINSRTRLNQFSFFAARLDSHSNSVYTAAYENFLRLFFSKQLLRSVYVTRSERVGVNLNPWAHTTKIKFTTYATPLHFYKNSNRS